MNDRYIHKDPKQIVSKKIVVNTQVLFPPTKISMGRVWSGLGQSKRDAEAFTTVSEGKASRIR